MGRKRCTKEYTVINLNPRNISEEERRRIILSLPKSVLKPAPPGYKPTKVYKELTEEELSALREEAGLTEPERNEDA